MSPINVFVSSAAPDLQPEQQAARQAIQNFARLHFAALQEMSSSDAAPLAQIDQAQVFVGLLGEGRVSPSFAAEYAHAQRQGLPCFTYLKSNALPAEMSLPAMLQPEAQPFRSERGELLTRLKHETRLNTYSDLDDLKTRLNGDLQRWVFEEYLPLRWQQALDHKLPKAEVKAWLNAIKDQRLLSASWRNQLTTAGFLSKPPERLFTRLAHIGIRAFAGGRKTLIGAILGIGLLLWGVKIGQEQFSDRSVAPSPPAEVAQATLPPQAAPSIAASALPTPASSPTSKASPPPKPAVKPTVKTEPTVTAKPTPPPTPKPTAPPPAPRIAISPPNVQFSRPGIQTITLANYASERIVISDVRFKSASPSFSIAQTNCRNKTLQRNDKCQVVIRYAPPPGTITGSAAELVIEHDGTQKSFAIGSATANRTPSHNVTPAPTSLEFGSVPVQANSAPRPLTLTNQGASSVQIQSVKIPGGRFGFGKPPFKADRGCQGVTLAPGAGCTIQVTFSPQKAGNQQASLQIKIRPAGSAREVRLNRVSLGGAGVKQ